MAAYLIKSVFLYITVALITGIIPVNRNFTNAEKGIDIYISSNGIHTDFVVPVNTDIINWRLFFSSRDFDDNWKYAPYIAFGWGDKGFYLNTPEWKDLRPGTAINALFLDSPSAMHVTLWPAPEENAYTKKVTINTNTYLKLISYIKESFVINPNGFPSLIDHPGYGSYDLFYNSSLNFNLFHTCNVWTNLGLKTAGIRTSFWTPFDKPILFQISKISK